jgi:hypothetical protein
LLWRCVGATAKQKGCQFVTVPDLCMDAPMQA